MGHKLKKLADHYCQARTWAQERDGTWGGSQNGGCGRAAVDQTPNGEWGCRQHLNIEPKNGWNRK